MPTAIKLAGNWDEGYALDLHTISSVYVGEDVFGNPQYQTQYTTLGQLLHSFKYNGRIDTSKEIVDLSAEFLDQWLGNKGIMAVLPTPPTADRHIQPVYVIAEAIAKHLHVPYVENVLEKITETQSKNMPKNQKKLNGTMIQKLPAKRKCNILLVDDIYSTGATATACVSVLRNDPLIEQIYYLAITKTRT